MVLGGPVRRRDETMQLQAMEVSLPDISRAATPGRRHAAESAALRTSWSGSARFFARILGAQPLHLSLTSPGRTKVMGVGDALRVQRKPSLYGDLKALLGPSASRLRTLPSGSGAHAEQTAPVDVVDHDPPDAWQHVFRHGASPRDDTTLRADGSTPHVVRWGSRGPGFVRLCASPRTAAP